MDFLFFTFINYSDTVSSAIQLYPEEKPTESHWSSTDAVRRKNSGISQNIFVCELSYYSL